MSIELPATLTIVFVCLLLVAEVKRFRAGVWLFKPLASLGFIVVALAAGATGHPYGQAVVAALLFSALGDVLLIPHGKHFFLAGLGSFLLGHVLFAVAFVVRGVSWPHAAGALFVLLVPAVLVGRWLLPHVKGSMRVPVIAYMTVITTMVALACGAVMAGGRPLMLVAAVAFYLSDLSVARDRFVDAGFINRAWGLPLYYAAQLMFAFSVT